MDRREAMLRELNLYPMWVRREPVAQETHAQTCEQSVEAAAVNATAVEDHASVSDSHSPVGQDKGVAADEVVHLAGDESGSDSAAPAAEDLFAGEQDVQPVDFGMGESVDVSLREFQLQNAGGALGRLDWPELKQKVHDCELCKLRAGCARTVFGVGDEQADWMFIGEAPGAEEDATGEPFVGHSGRLLDNMLLAIKLKRSETYIANVIKCRPPDDRHPHVGEIDTCLPYLRRQIDLVKPRVIVALGKTAASALLETDATIASLRGTVHDYKGIPLIVTFHPAYLLRSPLEKAKAWQDLCLAVETMNASLERG
ncbi:MAG: uracil-DNA glycosylase [Gallionella sp.]|jgi:DNA polymerase